MRFFGPPAGGPQNDRKSLNRVSPILKTIVAQKNENLKTPSVCEGVLTRLILFRLDFLAKTQRLPRSRRYRHRAGKLWSKLQPRKDTGHTQLAEGEAAVQEAAVQEAEATWAEVEVAEEEKSWASDNNH